MTGIELNLVVHLEDGTVITAEPTTILIPPSTLLRRARERTRAAALFAFCAAFFGHDRPA